MAYTQLATVNTGDLWTAANHNTYIKANFTAIAEMIGCQVFMDGAAGGAGGYTNVPFDTEDFDTDSIHALGTPGRFTIPVTGYYHIYAHGYFNTGSKELIAVDNGGTWLAGTKSQDTSIESISIQCIAYLTAAQTVDIQYKGAAFITSANTHHNMAGIKLVAYARS